MRAAPQVSDAVLRANRTRNRLARSFASLAEQDTENFQAKPGEKAMSHEDALASVTARENRDTYLKDGTLTGLAIIGRQADDSGEKAALLTGDAAITQQQINKRLIADRKRKLPPQLKGQVLSTAPDIRTNLGAQAWQAAANARFAKTFPKQGFYPIDFSTAKDYSRPSNPSFNDAKDATSSFQPVRAPTVAAPRTTSSPTAGATPSTLREPRAAQPTPGLQSDLAPTPAVRPSAPTSRPVDLPSAPSAQVSLVRQQAKAPRVARPTSETLDYAELTGHDPRFPSLDELHGFRDGPRRNPAQTTLTQTTLIPTALGRSAQRPAAPWPQTPARAGGLSSLLQLITGKAPFRPEISVKVSELTLIVTQFFRRHNQLQNLRVLSRPPPPL